MIKKLWLLACFPFISFAQTETKTGVLIDLSNPRSTIYSHLHFLQPNSYQPKKAAKTIFGLSEKKAIKKSIKIKQVLDGRGLFVDMSKIPTNSNYKDSIANTYRYVLFPKRMPKIYLEKIEKNWYYSKETILEIDNLYNSIYPWYVQKIESLIPITGQKKILSIGLWQIVGLLILLLLTYFIYLISKKIAYYILKKIQNKIAKNASLEINKVLKKLSHPVSLLIMIAFFEKIFPALQFNLSVNTWVFLLLEIAKTVFWIYIFLQIVQVIIHTYSKYTEKTENKLDDQLVPILNSFLRGIVITLGVFKLLIIFGVNVTTLIAGATIGGLAFALASQDTVKNLIGTIMIFIDKPFRIEDWIETGEVVGTVEKVGFRSTQIRAADTSIYQIPNSKLSEIVINNKGLRLYRRYNTNLGLRYDTPPELIEAFIDGIKKIITAHPETRSDSYNVELVGLGDFSLQIMVNMYFKSLAWDSEQSSKHKLNIAILKLAKELGVGFAFPTKTIEIEQFPDKSNLFPKYNIDEKRIAEATSKVLGRFENENNTSKSDQ